MTYFKDVRPHALLLESFVDDPIFLKVYTGFMKDARFKTMHQSAICAGPAAEPTTFTVREADLSFEEVVLYQTDPTVAANWFVLCSGCVDPEIANLKTARYYLRMFLEGVENVEAFHADKEELLIRTFEMYASFLCNANSYTVLFAALPFGALLSRNTEEAAHAVLKAVQAMHPPTPPADPVQVLFDVPRAYSCLEHLEESMSPAEEQRIYAQAHALMLQATPAGTFWLVEGSAESILSLPEELEDFVSFPIPEDFLLSSDFFQEVRAFVNDGIPLKDAVRTTQAI